MQNTRVALISYNANKYSETFIQPLRSIPNCQVYFLYGGELPKYYGDWVQLHNTSGFSGVIAAIRSWLGTSIYKQHQQAVEQYLLKNQIQVVYANYSITAFPLMEMCQRNQIPLVVHFHGWTAYRTSLLDQYKREYEELFKMAAAVIYVSHDMGKQLLNLGAPENKLHYVPYGISPDLFSYQSHSANPPVFLSAGRFCDTKNPHLTILAFSKVLQDIPDARLVMAGGDETLLSACFTLCKALKIEHAVWFKGVLKHEQVAEEMKNAYAFVQHSATTVMNEKEGTPNAIMEAMASGLPVVATRHAGIPDVITYGETGLLCSEYDIDTMAKLMIQVWNDKELAAHMGKKASEYIHKNYTRKMYLDKVATVIGSVIKE